MEEGSRVSEHHQFIFPRYRHVQAPDWKGLEQRLLSEGLLEPAVAQALDETGDREGCLWASPLYRPSHGLFRLLEVEPDEEQRLLLFEFARGSPFVCIGENFAGPCLPGQRESDEEYDEPLMEFISDAIDLPSTTWCGPDGAQYYLMELDFDFSFGVGEQVLRTDRLDRAQTERLAALIGELCGQPMSCAHRHR